MAAEGWSHGSRFDPATRTHDALVPFKDLDPMDQRETIVGIMSLELTSTLRSIVEYPRDEVRELTLREVRPGMRVRSTVDAVERGTIESWIADPTWPGCLSTIRVRWDSGEVIDHAAAERELTPDAG